MVSELVHFIFNCRSLFSLVRKKKKMPVMSCQVAGLINSLVVDIPPSPRSSSLYVEVILVRTYMLLLSINACFLVTFIIVKIIPVLPKQKTVKILQDAKGLIKSGQASSSRIATTAVDSAVVNEMKSIWVLNSTILLPIK